MNSRRFVMLVIAALVVMSAALLLATRRNSSQETHGVALLPWLSGDLNAVTEVSLRKGGAEAAATLRKSAAGWIVMERGGYPADLVKLRQLLSALGDAKIVEEKTADPALYAAIGVADASQPGAGTEITVVVPGGRHALIVGKSVGEGNFVRRVGEKQSYSVEPAIAAETEPHSWIDSRLLDVPATQIQRIMFKPVTGAAYVIHRSNADAPFSLDGVPAGRAPVDAGALAPSPTTFAALAAEDVAPLDAVDFSQPVVAELTLTDGEVITLTGVAVDNKHWLQIKSTKNPVLTAKAQGRAFEVAGYRYDALFKPLEQLLVPKQTVPKSTPAAAPRAPKKP